MMLYILPVFLAMTAVAAGPAIQPAPVTQERIVKAEPGNWMSYGRDYFEQRFSPLTDIDTTSVSRLGLAWSFDIDEIEGIESTPLVIDGVMYVTASWSKVYALDAATGKELWRFDPEVDRSRLVVVCCSAVNRGVAAWNDKIYVGTIDGRLIALDAATGKPVWDVVTVDQSQPYSITGAPRAARGLIYIGNAGADVGVRGYVTAYDADSGQQVWRFYTVPGDPAKGFEDKTQEMAAKTWTGEWWKFGGGGTAWDSIVYDPELDQLLIGVGNGAPWNQHVRSPGGGDNLFLASIVAVDPKTGEYKWHYQVNPGETWDFSASMPMILATLTIDGRDRKVVMQTPKNGFFYVVDRETGKLISAKPHVDVTWATGIDVASGRPIETPDARYPDGKVVFVKPGAAGAGNWHPMSFDPRTATAFFQSREGGGVYLDDPAFKVYPNAMNKAVGTRITNDRAKNPAPWPAMPGRTGHSLVAWDPVTQTEKWRVKVPFSRGSAVLSTAGGLVFQGRGDGKLVAYDSRDGRELWSTDVQNIAVAPAMSYRAGKDQYVAVAVGWGYTSLVKGPVAHPNHYPNTNRVLAFRLGANTQLPPVVANPPPLRAAPKEAVNAAAATEGSELYEIFCSICHGGNANGPRVRPDLRFSDYLDNGDWDAVVRDGALKANGMAPFASTLSEHQSEAIRAFVVQKAQERAAPEAPALPHQ